MEWFKHWHGMINDPKLIYVAKTARRPMCEVVAVYMAMMENASANEEERGTLKGWDHEVMGCVLEIDPAAVKEIYVAMQGKLLAGNRVSDWETQQPAQKDTPVARVTKRRSRKRAEANRRIVNKLIELGDKIDWHSINRLDETNVPSIKKGGRGVKKQRLTRARAYQDQDQELIYNNKIKNARTRAEGGARSRAREEVSFNRRKGGGALRAPREVPSWEPEDEGTSEGSAPRAPEETFASWRREEGARSAPSRSLLANAEGLGLNVKLLRAATERAVPRNPSAYFRTLCVSELAKKLPRVDRSVLSAAMSGKPDAKAAVMSLLVEIADETVDA